MSMKPSKNMRQTLIIALVDTYDTLKSGIPNAKLADEYLKPNGIKFKGIRIDSGDLAYLSKEARKNVR